MPRILVLADLGQSTYHVGDEAMGIAAAEELTRRGFEVTIATRDIRHSQEYIASPQGYIRTLPFPWPPAEREAYLQQLAQHLEGQEAGPEITDFVRQVSAMDGILIAGGGNMNSTYGWLLYERAAYGLIAQAHSIPLVISGQSLGPVLTDQDAQVLRTLLSGAQLLGLRENRSLAWARAQGLSAHQVVDDASFYRHRERTLPGRPVVDLPPAYLCATFDRLSPSQARAIAQLLDEVYQRHGLSTVFLPHMGQPLQADGDQATHALIASYMLSQPIELPMVHADDAVQVHRDAQVNFSSRYHPGVFSLAGGVPHLALLPDAFTDMRVRGMMEQYGAGDYALALDLLETGAVDKALHEVIAARQELGEIYADRAQLLASYSESWWDAIGQLFHGQPLPPLADLLNPPALFTDQWNLPNLLLRDRFAELSLQAAQAWAEQDRAQSWQQTYRQERELASRRLEQLEEESEQLRSYLQEAEEGATLKGWMRRKMRGD